MTTQTETRVAEQMISEEAFRAAALLAGRGHREVAIDPASGAYVHAAGDPEQPLERPHPDEVPPQTVIVELTGDPRQGLIEAVAQTEEARRKIRRILAREAWQDKRAAERKRAAEAAVAAYRAGGASAAIDAILEAVGEDALAARDALDRIYGTPGAICQPRHDVPVGGWTVGEYFAWAEQRMRVGK